MDATDQVARRAIGGDPVATAWVLSQAGSTTDATLIALAALLDRQPDDRLRRAEAAATSRRDRQLIAITRAHLAGRRDLVDALARDHLVDFPDSYVVSWIASGAAVARLNAVRGSAT